MKIWNGTTYLDPSNIKVWNGSSWADANAAYVWTGSSWTQFFGGEPALEVTATPSAPYGYCYPDLPGKPCRAAVSLNGLATGGLAPYTYAWEYGYGDSLTMSTPNSPTCEFSRMVNSATPFIYSGYRLKVTDSAGTIEYSDYIDITLEYMSY